MFSLIEVMNFRSLRFIRRPLGPLQILVGSNASGKTTFLDVLSFLGTLATRGLQDAFRERSQTPIDLLWQRQPGRMEIAIEARIPEPVQTLLADQTWDTIRYEIALLLDSPTAEPSIEAEKAYLKRFAPIDQNVPTLFPDCAVGNTVLEVAGRRVFSKTPGGNDNFYSETYEESGKGWAPSYKLGPFKSALANLPADEEKFPASVWLRSLLERGVQKIVLNSLLLRLASPPGQSRGFRPDGSNLPWVIKNLKENHKPSFDRWLAHVQTALPEVLDISVIKRDDDLHAYLMVDYFGGLRAPSWVLSDGTLRLLALTALPYLPPTSDVYLIEEPENGIHPTAVETVYQSLSSVYGGQVLAASHSPVLLSVAKPDQLLCFAKTADGATDIVRGDRHPALQEWRGEVSLGTLLAAGVFGGTT